MSDTDTGNESTTDENSILEDEDSQPASGDDVGGGSGDSAESSDSGKSSDSGDSSDSGESSDSSDEGSILDDGGIDTDERAGRSLGIDPQAEPDDETKSEIEEEREKRLDPDNRPEGAEIDNTPRDFDVERGQFKDSDDYDESEPPPFRDPEDPNNAESDSDDSDETETKDDSASEDKSDSDDSADTDADTDEDKS